MDGKQKQTNKAQQAAKASLNAMLRQHAYQPHHRLLQADALLKSGRGINEEPDVWVRDAAQLMRLQHRGDVQPSELTPRLTAIGQACGLFFDKNTFPREVLEAVLFAGEIPDEAADQTGLPPELIDAYLAIYFDVTDDAKRHFAFGTRRVVGDCRQLPSTSYGEALLEIAHQTGQQGLRATLDALKNIPGPTLLDGLALADTVAGFQQRETLTRLAHAVLHSTPGQSHIALAYETKSHTQLETAVQELLQAVEVPAYVFAWRDRVAELGGELATT